MKMKGNLIFLISVVFVILVFGSMTITGCAAPGGVAATVEKQHTTHEDGAQPPQPGQSDEPVKGLLRK